MTTISWISTLGGDWSDGANWQGGVVPGPLDDAIMMLGGTETITISSLQNVHSIAFHDPSAVIEINPLGTLEANADIVLECADLNVHGTLVSDNGGIAITVLGTIDLALGSLRAGNGIISFTTGDINVGPVSCFVSGTRIAARKGLVPVEELVVGDEVHAHFSRTGGAVIQWIGRRHIDCRRPPNPERIWPVRVSAGAFGNAPCRDLWLSPDHAVSMCNVLIPIRLLINDSTIRQIPVDEVTYQIDMGSELLNKVKRLEAQIRGENRPTWEYLHNDVLELAEALGGAPGTAAQRLGILYPRFLSVVAYLEVDLRARRGKGGDDGYLNEAARKSLADIYDIGAMWLRGYPTVKGWDDQLAHFSARVDDLLAWAAAFMTNAQLRGIIPPVDAKELTAIVRTASARTGPVAEKAERYAIGEAKNLLAEMGRVSISDPPIATPILLAGIDAQFSDPGARSAELAQAMPADLRPALESLIEDARDSGARLQGPDVPDDVEAQISTRGVAKFAADRPRLVSLPTGSFLIGSPAGEDGSYPDERPQTRITIAYTFALGATTVTFDDWDTALAAGAELHTPKDYGFGRGSRPVIDVSWEDAQAYIRWLNQITGLTGRPDRYRLPSEAEWEYACRADANPPTQYSFGNKITPDLANYEQKHGRGTMPVASFPPNEWQLHDMHGNVWEWCEDAWSDSYKGISRTGAPRAGKKSSSRVLRGGSWNNGARGARSAYRNRGASDSRLNDVGFRLARTLSDPAS